MRIDKAEIACRFGRSVESYEENAHIQKVVVSRLAELLGRYCPGVPVRILEAGCGTGLLTERIRARWPESGLWINDLVDAMCRKASGRCGLGREYCLPGDIETLPLEGEFSLIVSASTFQWLAQPEQTFARLARHIEAGGLLVFSTFGEETCRELKAVTGEGLHYRTMEEMANMLSAFFDIVHMEQQKCTLMFDNPVDILRHVKQTGVNATTNRQPWTRGRLERFATEYNARFLTAQGCPLTYHPLYFVCRKSVGKC